MVGWYHSHPGFGCWLSSVDMNTQQAFEQLHERAVAVVIDPIQSVKGKVVIDAFRLINPHALVIGQEPRQTTNNVGHLNKPSIQALIHGLNRHYYSIPIAYRKNELEEKMLLNLHKKKWNEGLTLTAFDDTDSHNTDTIHQLTDLASQYVKSIQEEEKLSVDKLIVARAGRIDAKRRLADTSSALMTDNISQLLGSMLNTIAF